MLELLFLFSLDLFYNLHGFIEIEWNFRPIGRHTTPVRWVIWEKIKAENHKSCFTFYIAVGFQFRDSIEAAM